MALLPRFSGARVPARRRRAVAVLVGSLALAAALPALPADAGVAPAPHAALANTTTRAAVAAPLPAAAPAMRTDAVAVGDTPAVELHGIAPFTAVAFSWASMPAPADGHVRVRVERAGLAGDEVTIDHDGGHGTDNGEPTAQVDRVTTDLYALGSPADGVVAVLPDGARDVRVHLVRAVPGPAPGTASALTASAPAQPQTGPPGMIPRSAWTTRERKYGDGCADGAVFEQRGCVNRGGVRNAVVHHTVNENGYSADAVPAILRSIQTFHMDTNGWDDIGYNVVVDRFGRIWEAREGGPDRAVVGGHTEGFNTGAIGVAVLGSFDSAAPADGVLDAVATVIAYAFAPRGVNPLGTVDLVSNGSERFEKGTPVTVETIAGHRQLGDTSCPGAALFDRLPDIRQRVAAKLAQIPVAGEFTTAVRTGGTWSLAGFVLNRNAPGPRSVRLDVDGAAVTTVTANPAVAVSLPATAGQGWACLTDVATGVVVGCRSLRRDTPVMGDITTLELSQNAVRVAGWAVDPDTTEQVAVHVYVDGVLRTGVLATAPNQLANDRTGISGDHGFDVTLPVAPGAHRVCAFGINDLPGGYNAPLDCRDATNATRPVGRIDAVVGSAGGPVRVVGWAIDPDTSKPIAVHAYLDTTFRALVADGPRPDLVGAFNLGAAHGFDATFDVPAGTHTLCLYAINDGPPDHTNLGCVTLTDATPPFGFVDAVAGQSGSVRVSGWAIDPDTSAPILLHVYVDNAILPVWADRARPDVAAAFGRGAAHGFDATVPAAPGVHRVCIYAINNGAGLNPVLRCDLVVVWPPNGAPPSGRIDVATGVAGGVRVTGWTLDPDTSDPTAVHVYVDGVVRVGVLAADERPDVAAALGTTPTRGFDVRVAAAPGPHAVCVYAINNLPGGQNTGLGCRDVLVR